MFKVTKSAPNTPLLKRQKKPVSKPVLSSSDEENDASKISIQLNSSLLAQQLQKAVNSSMKSSASKNTSENPPDFIVHKPSIKTIDSRNNQPSARKERLPFNTLSKERLSTPPRLKQAFRQKSHRSSDSSDTKPSDQSFGRSSYPLLPSSVPNSTQRLRHHSSSESTRKTVAPEPLSGTLPRSTKSRRKIIQSQNSSRQQSADASENNQRSFKR